MNTLDALDAQSQRTDLPDFRAGDTLKVHARVVEGNRSRVQVFQGVVIARQGAGLRETFKVRKISFGVGVERTYPINSPAIDRIEVVSRGDVRRVDVDPPIAVFHTDDGEVFAIDDTCTHQDASLADGWLEGCDIECPLHASRFNLRTGAVDAPPAKLPVRTHEVVIVDGMINVILDDAPPNLPPGVSTKAVTEGGQ